MIVTHGLVNGSIATQGYGATGYSRLIEKIIFVIRKRLATFKING